MMNKLDSLLNNLQQQKPIWEDADGLLNTTVDALPEQPKLKITPMWQVWTRRISSTAALFLILMGLQHPLKCLIDNAHESAHKQQTFFMNHPTHIYTKNDLRQYWEKKMEYDQQIINFKKSIGYESK